MRSPLDPQVEGFEALASDRKIQSERPMGVFSNVNTANFAC